MFARRKINSVGFGPRVLALICILSIAIPSILYLGYSLLRLLGVQFEIILLAMWTSLAAGAVLLAGFILLLAVEFFQDQLRDKQFSRTRNAKVKISAEFYECQFCGNRQVRESDKRCNLCGRALS